MLRGRWLRLGSRRGRSEGHGLGQGFLDQDFEDIDSFAEALRNELKDTGITVTCLMPGATDTEFFERAALMDTKIGQGRNDDPVEVAKAGLEAMQDGEARVITGLKNKLQVAASHVTPSAMLAEQHRKQTEPGSAS